MPEPKGRKSFRLTPRTLALLEKLASIHDTTQTRVIEEAIKEKAKREKISVNEREEAASS